MSERIDFYALHARTLLGMPEGWRVSSWQAHSHTGDHGDISPKDMLEVWGGVFPAKTRGKNKGKTDWKHPEPGTKRAAFFTLGDHEAFLRKWEAETGKCHKCQGTTQEWAGWSAANGNEYRPCSRCKATGAAIMGSEGEV